MLNATGWTTPINGALPVTFVEYGNTGDGATPERLALRANGGVVLTQAESLPYTISNVFKKDTDPSFLFDWVPETSVNIDFGTLAVNDFKGNKTLVYPNPFSDQVNIALDFKSDSEVSIHIYDVNGRVVKTIQKSEKKGLNNLTIDTKDLNTGIYFYNLKTNSGASSGKLIRK